MHSLQPSAAPIDDSNELARFREEWKAEVRRKKAQADAGLFPEDAVRPHASQGKSPDTLHWAKPRIHEETQGARPAQPVYRTYEGTAVHAPSLDVPLGKTLGRAVDVYRRAVQCEQQGNLNEALQLYRTAFRIDSNVDRAYHKVETQLEHASHAEKRHKAAERVSSIDALAEGINALDLRSVVVRDGGASVTNATLASILASWPQDLAFEPEDEKQATPLQRLPNELLAHILQCLNITTLERFARVNRKARVVSLDMSIWRDLVRSHYRPPQLPHEEDLTVLVGRYSSDYRRLFIEHPRVRWDGVYIAVCHYIRAGASGNAWVNVSHLITYHRYLRFYPNGQVLSLLANEEMPPQQIIPVFKPTLHMKGLFIGNWHLSGTTVHITSLTDPHPSMDSRARYAFQMTLDLRSRPLGRWNRLDFRAYDSVDIESGETTPLALKHERPFWFSKVRSYDRKGDV